MKSDNLYIENLLSECKVKLSTGLKERILSDAKTVSLPNKSLVIRSKPKKWPYVLAACCLLILVSVVGVLGLINEDYMQVYIDVNPSVSLSINRFGNVVDVSLLNKDAEVILKSKNYKGKNADDAIEEILVTFGDNGYLNDAQLSITTKCKNEKQAQKMQERLEKRSEKVKNKKNYNVKINQGKFSDEEKEDAKNYDISPAKYHLISQIIKIDGSYTVDSLKDKSIKELKDLLNTLQPEQKYQPKKNKNKVFDLSPKQ